MLTYVRSPVKTRVSEKRVTLVSMSADDERPIETKRFLALIDQLTAESGGSERAAMVKLACFDPSYAVRLRKEPWRSVGQSVRSKIQKKLGLDPRFFDDPTLGETPRYRDHLLSGTRVDRDEDERYPGLVAYLIANPALDPAYARELRQMAVRIGPDHFTFESAEKLVSSFRARDAGKTKPRPEIGD